jgi:membrane protein CcdC involved in cytochrome C biogenesis
MVPFGSQTPTMNSALNVTSKIHRRNSAGEIKKNALSGFFHIVLDAMIITRHIFLITYSARKNCMGSALANEESKFSVCHF